MINAETFTPVGSDQIPTGEIRAVAGTAMDFRRQRAIGEHVAMRRGISSRMSATTTTG